MGTDAEVDVRSAAGERARAVAGQDPLFELWARSSVGEPVLVRTVTGAPSYWVVPIELEERAIGFVRVTREGKAVAAGALYREPGRPETAPAAVTGSRPTMRGSERRTCSGMTSWPATPCTSTMAHRAARRG